MNPLKALLSLHKDRKARERLAELVQQTRNSPDHARYLQRRAAALKGLALKRERAQ